MPPPAAAAPAAEKSNRRTGWHARMVAGRNTAANVRCPAPETLKEYGEAEGMVARVVRHKVKQQVRKARSSCQR